MERYYNIAGKDICIMGKDDEMYTEEYRLAPFGTVKKAACNNYLFSIVDDLEKPSGVCIYKSASKRIYQDGDKRIQYIGVVGGCIEKAYIRCEAQGNTTRVRVKRAHLPERITSKVVLNAIGIEMLAAKADGFILHASFIKVNGQAILFTAPSGIGKSTQAELWRKLRGAEIINGDRAIVQVRDDNVYACGLPFAGSSEYCQNAVLPLAAIVCLEQAKETTISTLKGLQAFRKMWEQITIPIWDRDAVSQISERLTYVLEKIPIYYLACTPDESAVTALERKLEREC